MGKGADTLAVRGIQVHESDAATPLVGPDDLHVNLNGFILNNLEMKFEKKIRGKRLIRFQPQTPFADVGGCALEEITLNFVDVPGLGRKDWKYFY